MRAQNVHPEHRVIEIGVSGLYLALRLSTHYAWARISSTHYFLHGRASNCLSDGPVEEVLIL